VGAWYGNVGFAIGSWQHLLVIYNHSSVSNDPVFYLNGTLYTTVETITPSGTIKPEVGCNFMIGNIKTATIDYNSPIHARIFDVRVYNMDAAVLTGAQLATALYNAGTPDESVAKDGIVFQAFSAYADRPFSAGHALTSTERLVENAMRSVGIPHGSPTIRANP
jgi:hypothetical protein